jgi:hypothetical protein
MAEEIEGMSRLDRVMLEVAGDSDGGAVLTVQGLPYTSAEVAAARVGQELPAPSGDAGDAPAEDGTSLVGLAGILVECGSGYCLDVAGTVHALDFGPTWWLQSTTLEPRGDLDGDGTAEVLADEIEGLVGSRVEVLVERGRSGDEADVHALNGVRYRGGVDEPPEWAGGPGQGFRRGGILAGPPPGVPGPPDAEPAEAGPAPAPEPPGDPQGTPGTGEQQPPEGGPPTHVPAGPPEDLTVGGLKGGPPQGTPGVGDEDADDEEEGDQTGPPLHVGGPPQGSGDTP